MSDAETRIRNAAAMIENPLFNEALDALEKAAVDGWLATKGLDTASREYAWATAKSVQRMRAYFQEIVDSGRMDAARATRAPLP